MGKIFLSYAREDKEAVRQIAVSLKGARVESWLDDEQLHSGDELLRTIAKVLTEVDYFGIVLTVRALTKPWVLTQMRMALTSEIERGRPTVIVMRLDSCAMPIELGHKLYLDFRGRFHEALLELQYHLNGVAKSVPIPKQTVIAEMVRNAEGELWNRLCAGRGSRDGWKQIDVANVIRDLRSDELEAAVAIGSKWSGQIGKMWERSLVGHVRRATESSVPGARLTSRR